MSDLLECVACLGEGRVADTDEREPWSMWEALPPGQDLAVRLGLVRPVPCPRCGGSGVDVGGDPSRT